MVLNLPLGEFLSSSNMTLSYLGAFASTHLSKSED